MRNNKKRESTVRALRKEVSRLQNIIILAALNDDITRDLFREAVRVSDKRKKLGIRGPRYP